MYISTQSNYFNISIAVCTATPAVVYSEGLEGNIGGQACSAGRDDFKMQKDYNNIN